MIFFKKLILNTVHGYKIKQYCLGNRDFIQKKKINGKTEWNLVSSLKPKKDQRIFYLKVNRIHDTSYICIQRWVDLAAYMDGFVFFVCDNKRLQEQILKRIYFHNQNFKFIKSNRSVIKNKLKKIIVVGGKKWRTIAHSMLTPFIHATQNQYSVSYNIDADDIEILLKPSIVAQAFFSAEAYANQKELDCFNLDMFVSRSFGVHWSFGCVYVRNPQKCLDVIKQNKNWLQNKELIKKYKTYYVQDTNWHDDNIDWLFTFLRDTNQLKLETFYIENAYVAHMPDRLLEHEWAFYFQWSKGYVRHPVLEYAYNDKRWAVIPIPNNLYKIDLNLSDKNKYEYLSEYHFCDSIFRENCLKSAFNRGMINQHVYNKYMDKNSASR